MTRSAILTLCLAALSAHPTAAQRWSHVGGFSVAFATSSVDAAAASDQGIGERGYGGEMGAFFSLFGVLTISADAEAMAVADRNKFSEATTGGTKKSSVSLYTGSLAVGLRTPRLPRADGPSFTFGVDVGHGWASGGRGIDTCVDCTHQNIGVVGGSFVEPRFAVQIESEGADFEIVLSRRSYGGGADLRSRFLIGIGGAWSIAPSHGSSQDTGRP